jgi:hypothetical protein
MLALKLHPERYGARLSLQSTRGDFLPQFLKHELTLYQHDAAVGKLAAAWNRSANRQQRNIFSESFPPRSSPFDPVVEKLIAAG